MVSRLSLRASLAAGVVATAVLPVWAGAPAYADHEAPCSVGEVPGSERLADTHAKDNAAFERMHVEQAQELGTGSGVKIAVIDSGVMRVDGLDVGGAQAIGGASGTSLLSGHGTIVAGLIAGPHGVAPDAQIYDFKVFDSETADISQGQRQLTSAGIIAGIDAVIAANRAVKFDVVNISLAVPRSDPKLEAAVARLVKEDLVVVAASGNKVEGSDEGFKGTPGNNAEVYPADYPGVGGG
ncbi:MAG: S8 family serine peptidase, partial [Acidimicrobiales bacterium]